MVIVQTSTALKKTKTKDQLNEGQSGHLPREGKGNCAKAYYEQ